MTDPVTAYHEGKHRYKCKSCDASFKEVNDFNEHIDSVHEGKKPFQCDICENTFTRKDGLQRHIKDVHEQHDLMYQASSFIWSQLVLITYLLQSL